MMKLFGLVLVVLCFSLAGFGLTNRLTQRVKRLEQGQAAIRQIRLTLSSSKASSLRVLQMTEHRTGGDFPLIHRCIELAGKGAPFPEACLSRRGRYWGGTESASRRRRCSNGKGWQICVWALPGTS